MCECLLIEIGPTDPPEYPWLYAIPGLIFGGGYIAAASTGMAGLLQAGYLVSSVLCISMMNTAATRDGKQPLMELTRLYIRSCISIDRSSWKHPRHFRCQLGVLGVTTCSWILS